jgi:hypothetical protein
MERGANPQPLSPQKRRIFRKQIVIPSEHGSWSWFLVPYFVGLLVAGQWNVPALVVLIGGLAGFLIRQPASVYLRIRSGKGRRSDESLAAAWMLILGAIALLSLVALLAMGLMELLWLLVPMVGIFAFYLVATRQRRAAVRTLWMELAGAVGLAAMAPAAYIAATGQLDSIAWALWLLLAGQNALGVLYVRLRIADTHQRQIARLPILWVHILAVIGLSLAALANQIPWLVVVPFAGYLVRAIWAVSKVRPVANIKRFGFSEIAYEILGGLLIATGWILY